MNRNLKAVVLGFVIWFIPFVSSTLVWDVEANAPSISQEWFSSLMAFTFAVGLGLALLIYFYNTVRNPKKESIKLGLLWFVQLSLLDLVVLVFFFGVTWADYFPILLAYLMAPIITVVLGTVLERHAK